MKESTKNNLRKLAALTAPVCAGCSNNKYRCCDKTFCDMASITMKNIGVPVPEAVHPTIPYMGEKGCIIPPEYRPVCSGFVCGEHLAKDRKLRREWARRNSDFFKSGDCKPMMENYPKPDKAMPRDHWDYEAFGVRFPESCKTEL